LIGLATRFFPLDEINIGGFPLMLQRAVLQMRAVNHPEYVKISALRVDGAIRLECAEQ
jgi:hypothetical protein